jgi:NhaP-type Na+/H+ or K+/H+ antiporter
VRAILEGESLVNDIVTLVAYKMAVDAWDCKGWSTWSTPWTKHRESASACCRETYDKKS